MEDHFSKEETEAERKPSGNNHVPGVIAMFPQMFIFSVIGTFSWNKNKLQ